MTGADVVDVCAEMRAESRVALAVHADPDLDAVGAAAGMLDLFAQLDADAALYIDAGVVLPLSDVLLTTAEVRHGQPPAGATLYALDSGSLERLALTLDDRPARIVNIDHHHDNTRFGDLDLVCADASSTSQIVCDMAAGLGLRPSPAAANALYAGISFDSGHFRHDSTTAHTFECAAALVRCGAEPTRLYKLLYETRSLASLRLWARALDNVMVAGAGRALVAVLDRSDYEAAGAGDDETEGIVESLRSVVDVDVAVLVRRVARDGRVRASLRSEGFDVSAVAALRGGGGHRQAAGFTTDGDPREVAAWLSTELDARLSTASS